VLFRGVTGNAIIPQYVHGVDRDGLGGFVRNARGATDDYAEHSEQPKDRNSNQPKPPMVCLSGWHA
jgi:hypothetical protein